MGRSTLFLAALLWAGRVFGGANEWTNDLIAHYRFDTNTADSLGRSPPFVVLNVAQQAASRYYSPSFVVAEPPLTRGALFVNGRYEPNASTISYLGTPANPLLDYRSFTVALDFCPVPEKKSAAGFSRFERTVDQWTRGLYSRIRGVDPTLGKVDNILTGGFGYRWIGFRRDQGLLYLTLNNQAFTHPFPDARVTSGRWHRLICSFDLKERRILTLFDGRLLEPIVLPADFQLEVIGTSFEEPDREFTFSNMSNGSVYYGFAAHLRIFRRALTKAELAELDRESAREISKLPAVASGTWQRFLPAIVGALIILLVVWRTARRRRPKTARPEKAIA